MRFILLAVVSLASQPLLAQTGSTDRWSAARATIREYMDRQGISAIAVAVAKDGKVVWEEGFGWANREKMIPATAHTMFSLASISKPFTATGIMTLVNQRKVQLDRPINDYLGIGKLTGLAGDASGATVRRVMNHTSGLPLHYQFFYADKGYSPPTMDETIARYGNLVTAPGTVFQYSNLGYGILDYVLERMSGQSYADFMRSEVFIPLGLTHTSIDIGPGLEPFAAERYDDEQRPVPFYTFDHPGGSAVYSSAHDLVRFGMFHLRNHLPDQRAILPDTLIDAMQQDGPMEAFGAGNTYNLGWSIHKSDQGYRRVEHTGGMPGVNTALDLYPTENLAVVVLTNASKGWGHIAEDIAGVMLPRLADSLKVARARPNPDRKRPPFAVPSQLAGTWTGLLRTWKDTTSMSVTFKADNSIEVQIGPAVQGTYDAGGKQLRALVNAPELEKNELTGRIAGRIRTPDAGRWSHTIFLDLYLVDGKLKGSANAQTDDAPVYYSLASYVELTKK